MDINKIYIYIVGFLAFLFFIYMQNLKRQLLKPSFKNTNKYIYFLDANGEYQGRVYYSKGKYIKVIYTSESLKYGDTIKCYVNNKEIGEIIYTDRFARRKFRFGENGFYENELRPQSSIKIIFDDQILAEGSFR